MSPIPLTQIEEAVTGVVERVGPSVVTIGTVQMVRDQYWRPFPIEGVGSGVIVSNDGLIVTNHHVVRNARGAKVELPDGRRFEATYLGGDPDSDLAVLKIDAHGLPMAELGDSDALRVGQLAIAIGSPFGNMLDGPTVTVGVVSALRRTLAGPNGAIEGLVQTDAPINPGNSGGALLDSSGRVIAINTAIIPHAQGIGFAVPVNRVREVLDEVAGTRKHARRPWLGIAGVTLTKQLAREKGLEPPGGVLVFQSEPGSPASRAGLQEDDLIRRLDGRALHDVTELRNAIASKRPGERIELAYERFGEERTARVELREHPATTA